MTGGYDEKPEGVTVVLTGRCNLSCPHCYAGSGKGRGGELALDAFEKIFAMLARHDIIRVWLMGGEPLMRGGLVRLIDAVRNLREVVIVSNGLLLTRRFAHRLREAGLESFQTSLDGATQESHAVTRGDTFRLVTEKIPLLVEEGFEVIVASVVCRHNWREMPAMVDLAMRLGASRITFESYQPFGRGARYDRWAMTAEDWDGALPLLAARADGETGIEVELSFERKLLEKLRTDVSGPNFEVEECPALRTDVCIARDGAVYPCSNLAGRPGFRMGSVLEHDLMELWHRAPEIRAFREGALPCPLDFGGYVNYRNFLSREKLAHLGRYSDAAVPRRKKRLRFPHQLEELRRAHGEKP